MLCNPPVWLCFFTAQPWSFQALNASIAKRYCPVWASSSPAAETRSYVAGQWNLPGQLDGVKAVLFSLLALALVHFTLWPCRCLCWLKGNALKCSQEWWQNRVTAPHSLLLLCKDATVLISLHVPSTIPWQLLELLSFIFDSFIFGWWLRPGAENVFTSLAGVWGHFFLPSQQFLQSS